MTEENTNLAALFAACWKDADLKARFVANPAAVLAEYGMTIPEGIDVKVVENADDCVHITLPATPKDHSELSDMELTSAAGGCNPQCLSVYNSEYSQAGAGCTRGRTQGQCPS